MLPYLNIIIDDLNSLAGIETRIESFIDIIEQK
jgi:predicted nucleotide-binding protein (sugar kinase/HSP70/actin superfamily)